jgi:hypothetical protein
MSGAAPARRYVTGALTPRRSHQFLDDLALRQHGDWPAGAVGILRLGVGTEVTAGLLPPPGHQPPHGMPGLLQERNRRPP